MRNTRPISNTFSKPPTTSRLRYSSGAMRRYRSMSSALWWVTNGLAVRAAGDRVEHRRLDLDEAAVLEPAPGEADSTRLRSTNVRARLVGDPQVDVALAVAGVDVGEPVPLVGELAAGLGEQRPRRRPSPTARRVLVFITSPVDADPVAERRARAKPSKSGGRSPRWRTAGSRPLPSCSVAKASLPCAAAQHRAGRRRVTVVAGLVARLERRRTRSRSVGRACASGSNRYGTVVVESARSPGSSRR